MIRISYLPPISPMRNTPFLRNYILTDELFGGTVYMSVRIGSVGQDSMGLNPRVMSQQRLWLKAVMLGGRSKQGMRVTR